MSSIDEIAELQEQDVLHPIDVVECIAEHHDWEFDRLNEDQIAMGVEGLWRTYSITLAWSAPDETLRMVLTFDMQPPEEKLLVLYEMLNVVNDMCWSDAFTFWHEQWLMVYRYGLLANGCDRIESQQIDTLIKTAISTAEKFYPAFQLAVWGDTSPHEALQAAIAEAYGRA